MKTLIISGGKINETFAVPFTKSLLPDYIVGVDHGLEFCARNNIRPDYIVGDFDSLAQNILTEYQTTDIPIRTFNPIKDATDTCIALEYAIEKKSTEIWILGATGTRFDHMLCNLQTLKKAYNARIPAYIVDEHNLISLPIDHHFTIRKEEQFGDYVSFFPLEEEVTELTLKGFFYPLDRHTLRDIDGLGVSNHIIDDIAEVSYLGGTLVMMQTKD